MPTSTAMQIFSRNLSSPTVPKNLQDGLHNSSRGLYCYIRVEKGPGAQSARGFSRSPEKAISKPIPKQLCFKQRTVWREILPQTPQQQQQHSPQGVG